MVRRAGRVASSAVRLVWALALLGCEPLIGADFGPYELATGGAGTGSPAGQGGVGTGASCAATENCATAADDDCDGFGNQTCGAFVEGWAVEQTTSDLSQDIMSGLAVGDDGAIVAGSFNGTLTLGGIDSSGIFAGLVTRARPGTPIQLVRALYRTGNAFFTDVGIADDGRWFVAGAYAGDLVQNDSDPLSAALPSPGSLAAVIARFGSDDAYQTSITGPADGEAIVMRLDVAGDGRVAAIGFTTGPMPAFGIAATPPARQFFAAAFDADLGVSWSRLLAVGDLPNTCGVDPEYQTETSLAIAWGQDGAAWATGMFCGQLSTDQKSLVGQRDAFVLKRNPSDQWIGIAAGDMNEAMAQVGRAIVATPDGGAVVAGDFVGSLAFPGLGALPTYGGRDLFLVKLTADLRVEWARSYGGGKDELLREMTRAPDGTLFITGHFTSETDFGTGPLGQSDGVQRVFVLALEENGEPIHSHAYGDPFMNAFRNEGRTIGVAPDGRVWIAGRLEGQIAFGSGASSTFAAQLPSGFVARFER